METTFGTGTCGSPITTVSPGDTRDGSHHDSNNDSRDSLFSQHLTSVQVRHNRSMLQLPVIHRSESRTSCLSNVSFNDENSEEVTVFIEEPNKKLLCPLCSQVFKDPVITTCGHTFCRKCVNNQTNECCPVDQQPLSVIVANIALQEQVGELLIYCKYGCKLAADDKTWERNSEGCPMTVKYANRQEHESSCDYALIRCPNGAGCPPLLKKDYDEHVKNCNRARCSHHKYSCEFMGTQEELVSHLETCKYEAIKGYLMWADNKIKELQVAMIQKDQDICFLRSMVGKLMERLENSVEYKIDCLGDSVKSLAQGLENVGRDQDVFFKDVKDMLEYAPSGDYVPQQTFKCRGTFVGHKGPVWCLCVQGDYVFSGSSDTTVKVWDTVTNFVCVKTLLGHEKIVLALCVFENCLYSGSQDNTIIVWNLENFEKLKVIAAHENHVCTLAAAKSMLFSGSLKEVKVWDVRTHELKQEITGMNHWVRALQSAHNHLYCGSYQTIKILDLDSLQCIRELEITGGSVYSIAVTFHHILCGTVDNAIHVWELSNFQKTVTLTGHSGTVHALAWLNTPSGIKVFSASHDRTLRVWSMDNMICTQNLDRHKSSVTCLSVLRGRVFSGSVDSEVKVWQ